MGATALCLSPRDTIYRGNSYQNHKGTDPFGPATLLRGTNPTNTFMWTKCGSQQQKAASINRRQAELITAHPSSAVP